MEIMRARRVLGIDATQRLDVEDVNSRLVAFGALENAAG